MKTFFYFLLSSLLLFMLLPAKGFTQSVAINADGSAPNPSAMLDVNATNKGILVPRMTAAQITAIPAPAQGLLVYQTEAPQGFYYFDGAFWNLLVTQVAGKYNFGYKGSVALGFNANVATKVNFSVQNYLNNVVFANATFTAPSSGIYSFTANMNMYGNTAASMSMGFYVNNVARSTSTFNIISGVFQNTGYTDNISLLIGDQVTVQINPSQYVSGFAVSFTGFKIN